MRKTWNLIFLLLAPVLAGCGQKAVLECENGVTVRLEPVTEKIIHVNATPEKAFSDRQSLMIVPQAAKVKYSVKRTPEGLELSTSKLLVKLSKADGKLAFFAPDGKLLSQEDRRVFTPITVEGKSEYSVQQVWESPDDEAFYGLGQQQDFILNHKGDNEDLYQYNTKISCPFVLSNKGYGILWDSYSWTRFGNPEGYVQLGKVLTLYDKEGHFGHLTGTYETARGERVVRPEDSLYFEDEWAIKNLPDVPLNGARVRFEGFVQAPQDGEYYFSLYYAGYQSVSIGGKEVVSEVWRPAWNPNSVKFKVALKAGEKTPVCVNWKPDGDVSYTGLRVAPYRTPEEQSKLSLWSEMNPGVDYYFIAGPSADEVISGYRTLTGKAQVMPKWVMGFWQSRERYTSQEEIVATLKELRDRHIPVDNIVQDWQYWKPDQWGSHEFDESRFPDPEKMLDDIHSLHGRYMISVWPKFYTTTENFETMRDHGYVFMQAVEDSLLDFLGYPETFYDAYNPDARAMFWQQMDDNLYSKYGRKIDSWWMDASEPNLRDCQPWPYQKALTGPTALGPSTEYFNAYALVNAMAIYEGQRGVDPDRRVFLLTRSGFPGLQRYSTASWSGDIGTSWTDMRAQMSAGLGYCMSGLPIWGMDIGGFSVESRFYKPENLEEWREMQTRWHQFGAFVPLFRTHGQFPRRELWNIADEGTPAYESILWYMRLRYRLMPYIYSLAGAVHFKDYTIMRALPMDFPGDPAVNGISDQWMFGPAFMPCPVYEYKARTREVYLPVNADWYDFYTGTLIPGGRSIIADAPYERLPLYVRAGSIVPFGPALEWSDEKPADPLRIYVYKGANGTFTLYEDENLNYAYEKGAYSTISFDYDEFSHRLEIGERKGSFPGMLAERTFVVVPVSETNPVPYDPDKEGIMVKYTGKRIVLDI